MQTVQLAIQDPAYRTALERALFDAGSWQVVAVAAPDSGKGGVIVVDARTLDRYSASLEAPERVVLITRKDPEHLARAWEAGIVSVVFEDEPIGTAMLAIMSAGLRAPHEPGCGPEAPAPAAPARPCRRHGRARSGEAGAAGGGPCCKDGGSGKEI
ncbi:MAG: hypothetical protein IT158_11775 [Bryobacterales bacterium]|nr:hypothetical protein [Bryobacterales bacterium]